MHACMHAYLHAYIGLGLTLNLRKEKERAPKIENVVKDRRIFLFEVFRGPQGVGNGLALKRSCFISKLYSVSPSIFYCPPPPLAKPTL